MVLEKPNFSFVSFAVLVSVAFRRLLRDFLDA